MHNLGRGEVEWSLVIVVANEVTTSSYGEGTPAWERSGLSRVCNESKLEDGNVIICLGWHFIRSIWSSG